MAAFERTISWELSQVQDHFQNVVSRRKKSKRKAVASKESISPANDETLDVGYLVTNSEGEEEIYYSAEESPVTSDNSESLTDVTREIDKVLEPVPFPSQDNDQKLSRKKKKKKRKKEKMLRLDFFQPLCDLMDNDTVSVDVNSMDLSNYSSVLSLSELCIRSIKKIPLDQMELQLPFLITSLVGHDRQISGAVASQVQWLEKLLGDIENGIIDLEKESVTKQSHGRKQSYEAKELKSLYVLMRPWEYDFRPITTDDFKEEGYHCPIPAPFDSVNIYLHEHIDEGGLLRYLLHYCNYFYPVTIKNEAKDLPKVSVDRVNYWMQTRYSRISLIYSKFFKLWPAYVHWARGNLRLAANAFSSELESFEVTDKVVILNEMGRMFIHFGEQTLAFSTFVKCSELELSSKDTVCLYQPLLMKACNKAMQAGVWDTGLLNITNAGKAKSCWNSFITLISEMKEFSPNIWFLHVAAVESRLRVHAGKYIPNSVPKMNEQSNNGNSVMKWLDDCEELLMSHNLLSEFPVLNYHLSFVYALKKKEESSRRAFNAFIDNFAGFSEWVMPGQLFQPPLLPRHQYIHPWQNLFSLAKSLKNIPILPLHWRVQLLYPLHPYSKKANFSDIADHSPLLGGLNLRLTSEGDLSGDMTMDFPPIRAILINPYNGKLLFRRLSSFQHYHLDKDSVQKEHLPLPLRIYESINSVVELNLAHRLDFNNSSCNNYAAMLHWYDNDGSHYKVDLRKLIRRKFKQAMLQEVERHKKDIGISLDDAVGIIDKMMDFGLQLSIKELSRYKKHHTSATKGKSGVRFNRFHLKLLSHVTFGKGTVMLIFSLDNSLTNVIVFVDCKNLQSFMSPKIHCCAGKGFSHIYPNIELSRVYEKKHLSHLKYAMATMIDLKTTLIFDEQGEVVNDLSDEISDFNAIIGDRLFKLSNQENTNKIVSCTILNTKKFHHSYQIFEPEDIMMGAPGLLFVRCSSGILVLHPGTLERINIDGLRDTDATAPVQDGFVYPQLSCINGWASILGIYKQTITDETSPKLFYQSSEDDLLPDDISDYGSCCVSLAVNDRFIILHCDSRTQKVKIEKDISLPGHPNDFNVLPGLGYLVCATQFADSFRSELYLLSSTGTLLGVLPCLGHGPRSFFSVYLPSCSIQSKNEESETQYPSGFYVFFNDGLGGICCIRLYDVL